MTPTIEKISAVTLRVMNMKASVLFYQNALGMELLYGGERSSFSSLRSNDSESAILNLEEGDSVSRWGRLIFHVADVDAFWGHLKEKGFDPEIPRDASWGERYFHMLDPDGHELSFARPLQSVGQENVSRTKHRESSSKAPKRQVRDMLTGMLMSTLLWAGETVALSALPSGSSLPS
jgi:catechol 2,3-dioxygenase-like lactoylglutathione lyase family enzyme